MCIRDRATGGVYIDEVMVYNDTWMDTVGVTKAGLKAVSYTHLAELRPILRFYRKNGTIYELPVIRDSYTRAYNNEVSYETENYGKETELLVKDDFYETTSGLYSPFGANTRETYIPVSYTHLPVKRFVFCFILENNELPMTCVK